MTAFSRKRLIATGRFLKNGCAIVQVKFAQQAAVAHAKCRRELLRRRAEVLDHFLVGISTGTVGAAARRPLAFLPATNQCRRNDQQCAKGDQLSHFRILHSVLHELSPCRLREDPRGPDNAQPAQTTENSHAGIIPDPTEDSNTIPTQKFNK